MSGVKVGACRHAGEGCRASIIGPFVPGGQRRSLTSCTRRRPLMLTHAEPTTGDVSTTQTDVRAYAWVVFALTVGLLLSDYMSRQVLNAVFPMLKAAWN